MQLPHLQHFQTSLRRRIERSIGQTNQESKASCTGNHAANASEIDQYFCKIRIISSWRIETHRRDGTLERKLAVRCRIERGGTRYLASAKDHRWRHSGGHLTTTRASPEGVRFVDDCHPSSECMEPNGKPAPPKEPQQLFSERCHPGPHVIGQTGQLLFALEHGMACRIGL